MSMENSRDIRIDLMRFIGIALIVLAHVNPPPMLFELRSFDVPMMVFLSAISFALSTRKENKISYIVKRFKRLVLPVWFFLTIYFIALSIFINLDFGTIIKSYGLVSGIGYVWFIRIIFIVSLLAPTLYLCTKVTIDRGIFFPFWLFAFLLSELLVSVPFLKESRILELMLLDWFGYVSIMIFGFGVFLKAEIKNIVLVLLLCLVCFLYQNGFNTQDFKYPPEGLYVVYGTLMSLLIYCFLGYINIAKAPRVFLKIALYISSNSIWIYLFHIPLVRNISYDNSMWVYNYLFVFVLSIFAVFIKNHILEKCFLKYKDKVLYRLMLG